LTDMKFSSGRGAKEANLYSEIAEGISSYGVTRHRHGMSNTNYHKEFEFCYDLNSISHLFCSSWNWTGIIWCCTIKSNSQFYATSHANGTNNLSM